MTKMNWNRPNGGYRYMNGGQSIGREKNYHVPPPPPGKSTMTFTGSFGDLCIMVAATECEGTWRGAPDRRQFITTDGAILNWARKSGKLWFQGKYEPRTDMESALRFQIEQWRYRMKLRARLQPTESEVRDAPNCGDE